MDTQISILTTLVTLHTQAETTTMPTGNRWVVLLPGLAEVGLPHSIRGQEVVEERADVGHGLEDGVCIQEAADVDDDFLWQKIQPQLPLPHLAVSGGPQGCRRPSRDLTLLRQP